MEVIKVEDFTDDMIGLVVNIRLENREFKGKIHAIIDKGESLENSEISHYYGTKKNDL